MVTLTTLPGVQAAMAAAALRSAGIPADLDPLDAGEVRVPESSAPEARALLRELVDRDVPHTD